MKERLELEQSMLKGLKANYNQVKKLRLNGQGRITFGKYEKEYIQSISDDLGGENEE